MSSLYLSESRIDNLKKRSKRCVCSYCGGLLTLRRIIFNDIEDARVEIFCDNCDRIEFGVEPEIYTSAKYFVEETKFNHFADLDENERTKQMNIAKVCDIMSWENMNLGFLNKEGFRVPVEMNENLLGECITLKEKDMEEILNTLDSIDSFSAIDFLQKPLDGE